jgi:hypothetical protein
MKNSHFRFWLRNVWLDNCDENDNFNQPKYSLEDYWAKYKWWLRREWRHQQVKGYVHDQ